MDLRVPRHCDDPGGWTPFAIRAATSGQDDCGGASISETRDEIENLISDLRILKAVMAKSSMILRGKSNAQASYNLLTYAYFG